MKTTYKKILVPVYLSFLLFGIFLPFNSVFAQDTGNPLVISADSSDFSVGKKITLTANMSQDYAKQARTIKFAVNPASGGSFDSNNCVAGDKGCSVTFTSNGGTFNISASMDFGPTYSNVISVINGLGPNPLTVSAYPANILPNTTTTITAKVISSTGGETIYFFSDAGGSFNPNNSCITLTQSNTATASCTVTFTASDIKTYNVGASVLINNQKYISPTIPILVSNVLNPSEENCAKMKPAMKYDATTKQCVLNTDLTYTPLAGLPGLPSDKAFDTSQPCASATYFNIIFKIIIGISAVLAMVMIIFGGIEYMTSGAASEKQSGKERVTNAIMGLLIALGAYMLLNTLNPQLLNVCLQPPNQDIIINIQNFEVAGGLTYNGQSIQVNFDKDAYPAAKVAEEKTGVNRALILAIFAQETNSGANTGKCTEANAVMDTKKDSTGRTQLDYLKLIVGDSYNTVNVSCSGGGSSHGGAIGFVQFLPSTWYQYRDQATSILGHQPSAWNTGDALMMEAVYIKALGGAGSNTTNQQTAANKYFGSQTAIVSCNSSIKGTYGQCVMAKMASIQQQIDSEIKNGTLTQ